LLGHDWANPNQGVKMKKTRMLREGYTKEFTVEEKIEYYDNLRRMLSKYLRRMSEMPEEDFMVYLTDELQFAEKRLRSLRWKISQGKARKIKRSS
jgi:hypothetical protein